MYTFCNNDFGVNGDHHKEMNKARLFFGILNIFKELSLKELKYLLKAIPPSSR
jgi:hypothetical protein